MLIITLALFSRIYILYTINFFIALCLAIYGSYSSSFITYIGYLLLDILLLSVIKNRIIYGIGLFGIKLLLILQYNDNILPNIILDYIISVIFVIIGLRIVDFSSLMTKGFIYLFRSIEGFRLDDLEKLSE